MGVEEQQARGTASTAAVEAGKERARTWNACDPPTDIPMEAAKQIVQAAHDLALGLDRSVCLADVYRVLSDAFHPQNPTTMHPADVIERAFTASSSSEGAAGFVSEPSTGGDDAA